MFDLETALRDWRAHMERGTVLSPREVDELEDHLRALIDLELELDGALTPARAFSLARCDIGEPTTLSREFARAGKPRWRRLLLAGCGLFSASWLLPAVSDATGALVGLGGFPRRFGIEQPGQSTQRVHQHPPAGAHDVPGRPGPAIEGPVADLVRDRSGCAESSLLDPRGRFGGRLLGLGGVLRLHRVGFVDARPRVGVGRRATGSGIGTSPRSGSTTVSATQARVSSVSDLAPPTSPSPVAPARSLRRRFPTR